MGKVRRVIGIVLILGLVFGFSSFSLAEEKGLVGYWKFDEGEGNISKDSSGMGNDGTIYGAEWVKGISGNALQFNGYDTCVDCGNEMSLNPTSAITIEAWVKFAGHTGTPPHNYPVIVGRGWNYVLRLSGSESKAIDPIIKFEDGTVETFASTSEEIPLDIWIHLVFTYDSSTGCGYTYIDSIQKSSRETTAGRKLFSAPSDHTKIGCPPGDIYWNGIIDEVKIYNRALSQEEIQAHYKSLKPEEK